MSVLVLAVRADSVTASLLEPEGEISRTASEGFAAGSTRAEWIEHAPEEIWQATLAATRAVLTEGPDPEAIALTGEPDMAVLWDRETLGAPRAAIASAPQRPDLGSRLAWVAEHEPHTWALLTAGRYAVGGVESYLLARLTRGLWHATDVSHAARTGLFDATTRAWSPERCAAAGVPIDALPEVEPSWGRIAVSDPTVFVGLEVPITALIADESAAGRLGLAGLAGRSPLGGGH